MSCWCGSTVEAKLLSANHGEWQGLFQASIMKWTRAALSACRPFSARQANFAHSVNLYLIHSAGGCNAFQAKCCTT